MKAEIIAIGSELLTPYRLDTNSLFLTNRLNHLGMRVARKVIVGDSREDLIGAFREALGRGGIVISIGGLGPTEDDLTREALAELLGLRLVKNEEILQGIRERFHRFGRTMPESNVRQAMVPEGAEALANPLGTAPGLWLETQGCIAILLPGPPGELEAMFDREVEPRLALRASALRLHTREMRVVGMSESDLDARIAPIYQQYENVETTILAARGEIQIHPRVWSDDASSAEGLLDDLVKRIQAALGDRVFSAVGEPLEVVTRSELRAHGATIATAESCTGGLLAERLTRVPGSSEYFLGGVICYSNDWKTAWTDVPPETIQTHGAVSSEVAIALAQGIRRRSGAMLGAGITGIAGPDGGTAEKPVGTVHIALASETGCREKQFRFPGEREQVRWSATQMALDWVRMHFIENDRSGN
jgi:nicotinamide-nucleotide amidase